MKAICKHTVLLYQGRREGIPRKHRWHNSQSTLLNKLCRNKIFIFNCILNGPIVNWAVGKSYILPRGCYVCQAFSFSSGDENRCFGLRPQWPACRLGYRIFSASPVECLQGPPWLETTKSFTSLQPITANCSRPTSTPPKAPKPPPQDLPFGLKIVGGAGEIFTSQQINVWVGGWRVRFFTAKQKKKKISLLSSFSTHSSVDGDTEQGAVQWLAVSEGRKSLFF